MTLVSLISPIGVQVILQNGKLATASSLLEGMLLIILVIGMTQTAISHGQAVNFVPCVKKSHENLIVPGFYDSIL